MKKAKEFPFELARRVTEKEVQEGKAAIEKKLNIKRKSRGRPPKNIRQKFTPISIRLHPDILKWARREAKKRGVGYQTVINEILLSIAA
jgi:uncharacterized protein (DUF4415 family)